MMKNKNGLCVTRLVVSVATMVVSIGFLQAKNTMTDKQGVAVATKEATVFAPKKLVGDKMFMLNEALSINPICILRIDLANKGALATLKELESAVDDRTLFGKKMGIVLDPLKQFFDVIQQYSFMVRPLVEESLFGKDAIKNPSAEIRAQFLKDSLLLQFLDSKTNNIVHFFEERIKNKEDLKNACSEVLIFFADLKASLSEKTIANYHAFIADLKKQKVKK